MKIPDLQDELAVFVFATLTYSNTHARKHAIVETFTKNGFEAIYVERPSSRKSVLKGSISLNRPLPGLTPPGTCVTTPSGIRVLPVPKKLSFLGCRVGLWNRANNFLINRWLRKFFACYRSRSNKKIFAIVTTPKWEPMLRKIPFDTLCYDKTDEPRNLKGKYSLHEFHELERRLIARADLLSAVTPPLAEPMRDLAGTKEILVVPNGADYDLFQARKADPVDEFRDIARPIVGLTGSMAAWIDFDLILDAADRMRDISFVLVGPRAKGVDLTPLEAQPNIHLFDRVPFARIPSIVDSFSVCLIPMKEGAVARSAKNTKLYDYLSLGKPIVTTHLPELDDIQEIIYRTSRPRDFVPAIQKALGETDATLKARREQYSRENSWSSRICQFLEKLA